MKKNSFLLFFLIVFSIQAQNVKVVYEVIQNVDKQIAQIPDKKLQEQLKAKLTTPKYYALQYSQNKSLYKEMTNEELAQTNLLDLEETSSSNVKVISIKSESYGVFKDYKTKKQMERKVFLGKEFFIEDNIPHFDWTLTDESQKIGNFNCKKATTVYNGDEITAWYAEDIPISIGPDFYNGLPGLIVKMADNNREYKAISVENLTERIAIEEPQPKGKKVSRDEFYQIRKDKIEALSNPIGR